jgi:hypothetical protein
MNRPVTFLGARICEPVTGEQQQAKPGARLMKKSTQ